MKFCSSKIVSFNHYNHLKQGKALRYLFSSSRCSKNGIIFVCAILHFVCAILHFVCAMYAILMYASAQYVCAIRCAIGFFFRTPPGYTTKNHVLCRFWDFQKLGIQK